MGCTQSKIENEETVTRCKDRKRFMKDAVSSRNAFAAAHSSYVVSLKNTGAALSDYSHGEVQHSQLPASSAGGSPLTAAVTQPSYDTLPPPPPPIPLFPPLPLQRANTMPDLPIPNSDLKHSDPIIEVDNEDEIENESQSLRHRSSRSSGGGGGRSGISSRDVVDEGLPPPPSPPRTPPSPPRTPPSPPPMPPPQSDRNPAWDFFFPPVENMPGPTLEEVDESRVEREEIERNVFQERAKRVEDDGGDGGGRRSGKAEVVETAAELPPQPPQSGKPVKKVRHVAPAEGKRLGKGMSGANLLNIFSDLDDCFLKASESAHEVSKMLEANRLHYHSNFADNRGITALSVRVLDNVLVFENLKDPDLVTLLMS